jgi:hypothetical protein
MRARYELGQSPRSSFGISNETRWSGEPPCRAGWAAALSARMDALSAASGRRTMASGSPVRAARPIEPQTSKSAKPDQVSRTIQQSRRAPATTASGFSPRMLPRVGGRRAAFRRTAGEAWQGRLVACCAGTMQRPLSPDEPRQHRRFLRGAQKLMHRNNARLIRPVRQSLAPSLGETVIARDVAVAKFGPPLERQFTSAETVACSIYKNAAVGYSMHASIGSFPLVFRKEH